MFVWKLREVLNSFENNDNILIRKRDVYGDDSPYSEFILLPKKNDNGDIEIHMVRHQNDSLPKELL